MDELLHVFGINLNYLAEFESENPDHAKLTDNLRRLTNEMRTFINYPNMVWISEVELHNLQITEAGDFADWWGDLLEAEVVTYDGLHTYEFDPCLPTR